MWKLYHQINHVVMTWVLGLDRKEWLIVLIVTMGIGFFCMRGFGSRNNY